MFIFYVIIRLTLRRQHSLSKDLKKLSDAVTKSYQSLMDEYPITMDQLYEVSKESTGVYYTHIISSFHDGIYWNSDRSIT